LQSLLSASSQLRLQFPAWSVLLSGSTCGFHVYNGCSSPQFHESLSRNSCGECLSTSPGGYTNPLFMAQHSYGVAVLSKTFVFNLYTSQATPKPLLTSDHAQPATCWLSVHIAEGASGNTILMLQNGTHNYFNIVYVFAYKCARDPREIKECLLLGSSEASITIPFLN
jgi:hypothetical protein